MKSCLVLAIVALPSICQTPLPVPRPNPAPSSPALVQPHSLQKNAVLTPEKRIALLEQEVADLRQQVVALLNQQTLLKTQFTNHWHPLNLNWTNPASATKPDANRTMILAFANANPVGMARSSATGVPVTNRPAPY
jgi:hypothetical protein